MPLEFDATLKDLVQRRPADFSAGFRLHGPGTLSVVNVDLSMVSASTDVVFAFGDPPRELVDLNFQTSSDESLVERLLLYNALLHYRYGVPVHSLLILLRPAADGQHLTGRLRYRGQGRRGHTVFKYEVIRLWQIPTRRLLRAGIGMLPLAMLGRLPEGMRTERGLPSVIRTIQQRAEAEQSPEQANETLTSSYILSGLRVNRETGLRLFEGVRAVRESTTYQAILDEGRIDELHETVLVLGRERFGAADEVTQAAIISVTDLDRLRRMRVRLLRVNSWQELLRTR
jgi:hypothetical protein